MRNRMPIPSDGVAQARCDLRRRGQRRPAQYARHLFVMAVLVGALAVGTPSSTFAGGGITPTPEPYSEYLVMIANGTFEPGPHPEVPGCGFLGIFCDGSYFQEEILGRSPAEIAQKEGEAKAWFDQRFGIDVDDPANDERVEFFSWTADPRWNYRVYTWSGRNVPSRGFEVRDGGWAIMISDPDGYTLGGELDGVHVDAGSMAVFGNYDILTANPAGRGEESVVLHYRANSFMELNDIGNLYIDCQMSREGFSAGQEGTAQGLGGFTIDEDGVLHFNSKNVITFDT